MADTQNQDQNQEVQQQQQQEENLDIDQQEKLKVFVGNLAPQTTEQELLESFSKYGDISSVKVVNRYGRGYGFVTFESTEVAQSVIDGDTHEVINEREINVEWANGPKTKVRGRGRGRRGRGRGRRGRGRGRRFAGSRGASTRGRGRGRRGRGRGGRGGRGRFSRRPRRGPRDPVKEFEGREKSNSTLYVTNIPFTLSDDEFHALFSEVAPLKSVRIIRRPDGASLGFGFVEFEDEDGQLKALRDMEGRKVEGFNGNARHISVRVAWKPKEENQSDEEGENNEEEEILTDDEN